MGRGRPAWQHRQGLAGDGNDPVLLISMYITPFESLVRQRARGLQGLFSIDIISTLQPPTRY